jgi:hypothetical protein
VLIGVALLIGLLLTVPRLLLLRETSTVEKREMHVIAIARNFLVEKGFAIGKVLNVSYDERGFWTVTFEGLWHEGAFVTVYINASSLEVVKVVTCL